MYAMREYKYINNCDLVTMQLVSVVTESGSLIDTFSPLRHHFALCFLLVFFS